MAFFINKYNSVLYVAADFVETRSFLAFIIPPGAASPKQDPELKDALTNSSWRGLFVFSAVAPALNTEEEAKAFYECIISNTPQDNRSICWANNISNLNNLSINAMGISDDGAMVISGLQADLSGKDLLLFNIPNGTSIGLSDTTLQLSSVSAIAFSGPAAPVSKPVYDAVIDFSGSLRGCISFTAYLRRDTIMDDPENTFIYGLMMGFEYLFPSPSDAGAPVAGFYPLAYPSNPSNDFLGFNISIDPTDAFNKTSRTGTMTDAYNDRRTCFNFTGSSFGSSVPVYLNSYYSTVYGAAVNLVPVVSGNDTLPARLVLCLGESFSGSVTNFYLAPEGDYAIQIPADPDTQDNFLICGMQGTEFFRVNPQTDSSSGDKLRFISGCAAFAPGYPFPTASPVGAPLNFADLPLSTAYTTSWATLVPAAGNTILYVAQPKGSSLFGSGGMISNQYPTLFGHTIPGFVFTPDTTTLFPLIPYGGTFTGDGYTCFSKQQMEDYERILISPVRRKQIGLLTTTKKMSHASPHTTAAVQTITTPSGLLATIKSDNNNVEWQNVLLGRDDKYSMQFLHPDSKLIEALQTADLFLVTSNATHLSAFENITDIGGWELCANVGENIAYGDYKNIMIIKGKKGKLFDTANPGDSLVANPNKWTLPNDFAAPSIPGSGNPDPGQLVNVSQWLQTYFQDAAAQTGNGDYFNNFNTIAADENWTGVLFLRIDIKALPANISGIVAGVTDMASFNAHHLAIAISPVKKSGADAVLEHASSMFGLIYYVDPFFSDAPPYSTLPSTTAAPYDFRLLTLKVLFENTAVKSFESYSQLTVTSLFGSAVSVMGDPTNVYNNVRLKGSFQMNGNSPVYNLTSDGDNVFFLKSNIIRKVEITKAVLTALDSKDAVKAASRFDLSGSIDYYALQYTDIPFDLFSFGSEDNSGNGLFFEHLGINMMYPVENPSDKTFTFGTTDVTFDGSRSTARSLSLYNNFALDEVTLISGTKEDSPDKQGFIPVIPDMRLSGVSGSEQWYGLKLRLNLGTPGELANKVNLQASLLLAWSPDSLDNTYKAAVYISLPGTSGGATLISLQNVLKLSIGQIRLTYDVTQHSFLLMFTEIALKFFGLLKIPPNGNTLFYLFGNPNSKGEAAGLGWYAMYRQSPVALLNH